MARMDVGDWAVLLAAATAAGWVDAVVGGGGLILLPALLLVAPQLAPQAALGTNKLTAIFGTGAAVWTFARRIPLRWSVLAPAALVAAVFAGAGAAAVSLIDREVFIPIVIVVLVGVAVFVAARPKLGSGTEQHRPSATRIVTVIVGAAAVIGFYDGILGPGTGTFLILIFAAMLGSEFVEVRRDGEGDQPRFERGRTDGLRDRRARVVDPRTDHGGVQRRRIDARLPDGVAARFRIRAGGAAGRGRRDGGAARVPAVRVRQSLR